MTHRPRSSTRPDHADGQPRHAPAPSFSRPPDGLDRSRTGRYREIQAVQGHIFPLPSTHHRRTHHVKHGLRIHRSIHRGCGPRAAARVSPSVPATHSGHHELQVQDSREAIRRGAIARRPRRQQGGDDLSGRTYIRALIFIKGLPGAADAGMRQPGGPPHRWAHEPCLHSRAARCDRRSTAAHHAALTGAGAQRNTRRRAPRSHWNQLVSSEI